MQLGEVRSFLRVAILVTGLVAVGVAVIGPIAVERSLRHQESAEGVPTYDFATTEPLASFADTRLQRMRGEATLAYVDRVTRVVGSAVYHCAPGEPQTWETLVARRFSDAVPSPEGVLTPRALRCGFCSQVSFVLAEVLRRGGISDAAAHGLDGHVVTTFTHRGREYVADADYGVGPFAVAWEDKRRLREDVRDAYASANVSNVPVVVDIFADTRSDGAYGDHDGLLAIAEAQKRQVIVLGIARWLIAGVGLVLILLAVQGTSKATPWTSWVRVFRRHQRARPEHW